MFASRAVSALVSSLALASSLASANPSALPADDLLFAQIESHWIAAVKDGISAQQCANEVATAGAGRVDATLESIGVLLVTTGTLDNRTLKSLPCIKAVEIDADVSASF